MFTYILMIKKCIYVIKISIKRVRRSREGGVEGKRWLCLLAVLLLQVNAIWISAADGCPSMSLVL